MTEIFQTLPMVCKHNKELLDLLICYFSFGFRMVEFSISNARYTYVHDQKYPSKDVDIHHIVLKRCTKYFFVYASALLVLAYAFYLYVVEVCLPTSFLFQ